MLKKFEKAVSIFLVVILTVSVCFAATAAAEDDNDTISITGSAVNARTSKAVVAGQTATYTLEFSTGSADKLVGLRSTVFFSTDTLRLKSASFPVVGAANIVENKSVSGQYIFHFSKTSGFDFSTVKSVAVLTFDVIASGTANVYAEIPEAYGLIDTSFKDFIIDNKTQGSAVMNETLVLNNNSGNSDNGSSQTQTPAEKPAENKTSDLIPTVSEAKVNNGKADISMNISSALLLQEAANTENLSVNILLPESEIIKQIDNDDVKNITINIEIPDILMNHDKISLEQIVLPQAVLKGAKSSKKAVSVKIKSGAKDYTWTFDSQLLDASNRKIKDVNLLLQTGAVNSGSNGKTAIKENGLLLNFSHSGLLPAETKVKLYALEENGSTGMKKGGTVYLYYYDKEKGKLLELLNNTYKIDNDGYVEITIDHCSEYVLLPEKASGSNVIGLLDEISIAPKKKTLYVNGTTGNTVTLKTVIPDTLTRVSEFSSKLTDSTAAEVKVTFKSSNTKVAAVNKKGKITAKKAGKTTITVTAQLTDGSKQSYKVPVTVKKAYVELVKSVNTMKVKGSYTFSIKTYGYKASDISWKTGKNGIITVSKNSGKLKAKVTAKKKGTDSLVILSKNKEIKSIKIVVKN